jgi:anti-sigma regulatory factor (Ser/Thr protein kinase)
MDRPHLMALTTPKTELLLALDPVPHAARAARHALRGRLGEELEHTVALLTSEIVGNAVRHARMAGSDDQIVFHARLSPDHARVEVADRGPGFDPDVRHHTPGFGLRLVDKLASAWGVERTGRGCRVWFEVDRRSGRFDRA